MEKEDRTDPKASELVISDEVDHVVAQFMIKELNRLCGHLELEKLVLEYSGNGKMRILIQSVPEFTTFRRLAQQTLDQLRPLLSTSPWRDCLGAGVPIRPMQGAARAALMSQGLMSMNKMDETNELITSLSRLDLYCRLDLPMRKPRKLQSLFTSARQRQKQVVTTLRQAPKLLRTDWDLTSIFSQFPPEICDKIVQKVALRNRKRLCALRLDRLTVDMPHVGLLLPMRAVNKQFYEFADRHMHRMGFPIKKMIRLENGLLTRPLENRRFLDAKCRSSIVTDEVYSRLLRVPGRGVSRRRKKRKPAEKPKFE